MESQNKGDAHGHVLDETPDARTDPRLAVIHDQQSNAEASHIVTTSESPDSKYASTKLRDPWALRDSPMPLSPEAPAAPAAEQPSLRVPVGFRGPQPHEDDAQDTAPAPTWIPYASCVGALGTVPNVPMNKNGWRYVAAGPAAHRLPRTVYRAIDMAPACVHWSWQDRSAFTRISHDASIVGTDKGYRSARTNVGVRHGAWYVEVEVLSPDASSEPATPMRDGAHVRVGWARREASLNAPVGCDAYSYGFRDQNGACVTQSRLVSFGRAFGPGDVVGMYIRLPDRDAPLPRGTEHGIAQKRIPIRYKGQLYFESLEYAPTREMEALMDEQRRTGAVWTSEPRARAGVTTTVGAGGPTGAGPSSAGASARGGAAAQAGSPGSAAAAIPRLEDSCIGFVVNGEPQGIAFVDLYDFRPLASRAHNKKRKENQGITPNTSASTVIKSRQNTMDDGMLGYYCMASMYGGARVRLITSNFKFPPPADLEDSLWRAGAAPNIRHHRQHAAPAWRPLAERYAEAWTEALFLDEQEDQRVASTDGT